MKKDIIEFIRPVAPGGPAVRVSKGAWEIKRSTNQYGWVSMTKDTFDAMCEKLLEQRDMINSLKTTQV